MSISRGSDVQVRITRADTGQLVRTWSPNSATFNTDANIERQKRLGTRRKPVRMTVDGHSGTMTFEVEGPELVELEQAMIDDYLAGEPEFKIEIIRRMYYPGRRTASVYKYPGACFSMNEDVSEQDSANTVTFNWTSEHRELVRGPGE